MAGGGGACEPYAEAPAHSASTSRSAAVAPLLAAALYIAKTFTIHCIRSRLSRRVQDVCRGVRYPMFTRLAQPPPYTFLGAIWIFGDVERELCGTLRPLLCVVHRAPTLPQGAVHPPVPRHGSVEGIDAASHLAVGEESGAALHLGGSVVVSWWRRERAIIGEPLRAGDIDGLGSLFAIRAHF